MADSRSQGGLRTAAVFCLCALFAVLAMGLTLLASGVYRDTVAESDANYTRRTALSYLVNQVRRADGGVETGTFGDSDALVLTETLDGAVYQTVLYCYEGQLRELYTEVGTGLTPADGVAVLPLASLSVRLEEGLLCFTITAENGEVSSTAISPRCGPGEVGAL